MARKLAPGEYIILRGMDLMITNRRVIRPRNRIYEIAALKSPRVVEARVLHDIAPALMWPALWIIFGCAAAAGKPIGAEVQLWAMFLPLSFGMFHTATTPLARVKGFELRAKVNGEDRVLYATHRFNDVRLAWLALSEAMKPAESAG